MIAPGYNHQTCHRVSVNLHFISISFTPEEIYFCGDICRCSYSHQIEFQSQLFLCSAGWTIFLGFFSNSYISLEEFRYVSIEIKQLFRLTFISWNAIFTRVTGIILFRAIPRSYMLAKIMRESNFHFLRSSPHPKQDTELFSSVVSCHQKETNHAVKIAGTRSSVFNRMPELIEIWDHTPSKYCKGRILAISENDYRFHATFLIKSHAGQLRQLTEHHSNCSIIGFTADSIWSHFTNVTKCKQTCLNSTMIIPIRCFTCGKVIGNKWEAYLGLLQAEYTEG